MNELKLETSPYLLQHANNPVHWKAWKPETLSIAKEKNIPTVLASALFRQSQIFFQFYGGFYKKILNLFSAILVQDQASEDLIKPIISTSKIFITGDTRFDRVINTAATVTKFEWIQKLSNYKIIIAGSTWETDHTLLAKAANELEKLNWIIVPHHVDAASIAECKSHFPKAITLTALLASKQHFTLPTIIIVDQIGILRSIYQYAFISYVGGGFGKDGVHNVLEPATFVANSILPKMSSLIMFPAIRTLKTSPKPWSKISSADVRLSIQLKITANGCCPFDVSLACCNKFLFAFKLFTNLLLPSFSISKANFGVILSCISLVNVFIFLNLLIISKRNIVK